MTRRMDIRACPSPNCGGRPDGTAIDTLVLHYTGMRTADEARARLCDPAAEVSAHYLVEEDGAIWRLVDDAKRAWHAGLSWWRGAANLNDRSIGIELVNPGHEFGYRPFPPAQMDALAALCHDLLARHRIPANRILGHSDVAPMRKRDPGELFDWRGLARQGIGLWPAAVAGDRSAVSDPDRSDALRALARIGYDIEGRSAGAAVAPQAAADAAITAFQRRFRPERLDGRVDRETGALIAAVGLLFA